MRDSLYPTLFALVLTATALFLSSHDAGGDASNFHTNQASLTAGASLHSSPPVTVETSFSAFSVASRSNQPARSAASNSDPEQVRFDDGVADFALRVKGEVIPYRIFGLFVMPGETVEVEAVYTDGIGSAQLSSEQGTATRTGPEQWNWTAPDTPGLYTMVVTNSESGDAIHLNVFVMTPFDHDTETLNGYRIGRYESKPLKGKRAYVRPDGFVEVTRENRDTPVSPHFTIGQFLCKQQPGAWPKYVLVQERLLLKLEMILDQVNEMGYPANTLNVMSGFRTPWYNRSIGNRTKYSQHLYGGAADVYVDLDEDDWMDDLTGDEEVTRRDAVRMANLIESNRDEEWYQPFVGGLGIYGPASHRGPFIHVDVRGNRARW